MQNVGISTIIANITNYKQEGRNDNMKKKIEFKKKKKGELIMLDSNIQELIEASRLTLMEYDKSKYNRRRRTDFKWEKF